MFWVHGLKVGDEVRLESDTYFDGEQYIKGHIFKITKEVWPDTWGLQDPFGKALKVTNAILMQNFSKVEGPKPMPLPKASESWWKQTKRFLNG